MKGFILTAVVVLSLACSSTKINVQNDGGISYAHRQFGTDVVGLNWKSEPAEDGGRYVTASMDAVVRPGDDSASQDTIRDISRTIGGGLLGGTAAGPAGAGVGMIGTNVDYSFLPFIGPDDEQIRRDLLEELIGRLAIQELMRAREGNPAVPPTTVDPELQPQAPVPVTPAPSSPPMNQWMHTPGYIYIGSQDLNEWNLPDLSE